MKRDMELVRKILLFVEGIDNTTRFEKLGFEGYSFDALDHHVTLLIDQGFLHGAMVEEDYDGISIVGGALTYEGHDFLDAARNETVWLKAMGKIGETLGSASLNVVKGVLEAFAKQQLGLA